MLELIPFVSIMGFIILLIIGILKKANQDILCALAFALFLTIASFFIKSESEMWIFVSLWILPFSLSIKLKEKHANLSRILFLISGFWFISFLLHIVYVFLIYALAEPIILFPSIFFFCFSLLIIGIYKNVFAPSKELKKLLEFPNFIRCIKSKIALSMLLSLIIPVCIFVLSTKVDLIFKSQILISVYLVILQVVSTLLGIIVTITIFLLSSIQDNRIWRDILIRSVKGLSVLYTITFLISIVGLMSTPQKIYISSLLEFPLS